jgi:peptidoglycan/xylan/chitin deacetylase (PgdA/CDA1 family)
MIWFVVVAVGLLALAHTAPAPFLLDAMNGDRAVWHMPRTPPPTVYLTYDDGPNPSTTPQLLDVLASEGAHATFFLIDAHITDDTEPIVRRMVQEGHAVALHSGNRWDLLRSSGSLAARLSAASQRIEAITGRPPCRLFRPHGGWRSSAMYAALRRIDYRLVGWGWMLWDFDFRERTAERTARRIASRASGGDIVVMHDGDEKAPVAPKIETVEATSRLVPLLQARGLAFGTLCAMGGQ